MEEIFPGIFRETEPMYQANVYYIDDTKKVQIDAGLVLNKPVDILILTHCHFDHIRCAAEIKQKNPKCTIAASEEAAVHIKNMDEAVCADMTGEKLDKIKIDMILGDGGQIFTGKHKLRVLKVPGHTSGDVAIYDAENRILFSGDTWFGGDSTGRFDLPTGNKYELRRAVERLKGLKVDHLFTGHAY